MYHGPTRVSGSPSRRGLGASITICRRRTPLSCASSNARAAARLSGLPSGNSSGLGRLLDRLTIHLRCMSEPGWHFRLASVSFELLGAHALERVAERCVLDFDRLSCATLGAVGDTPLLAYGLTTTLIGWEGIPFTTTTRSLAPSSWSAGTSNVVDTRSLDATAMLLWSCVRLYWTCPVPLFVIRTSG